MKASRKFSVALAVLILALMGVALVREGESADVNLAKKACHIIKGEDGKFAVETWEEFVPDFKSWSLRTEVPRRIMDVHNYVAKEVTYATQAAQVNPVWRSLADAQVDAMNNLYFAYLLLIDNPNSDRVFEVMPTLNAALNKARMECVAFRDRLNS